MSRNFQLSSEERKERLRQSHLAQSLRFIRSQGGAEYIFSSADFSQDEKDFILFHITDLRKISKMTMLQFREAVKKFKREELLRTSEDVWEKI